MDENFDEDFIKFDQIEELFFRLAMMLLHETWTSQLNDDKQGWITKFK